MNDKLKENMNKIKGKYPFFTIKEYMKFPFYSSEEIIKGLDENEFVENDYIRPFKKEEIRFNTINPLYKYCINNGLHTTMLDLCWIISNKDKLELTNQN